MIIPQQLLVAMKKISIDYKNIQHSVEMISRVHPNIMLKSLWLGRKKSFQT